MELFDLKQGQFQLTVGLSYCSSVKGILLRGPDSMEIEMAFRNALGLGHKRKVISCVRQHGYQALDVLSLVRIITERSRKSVTSRIGARTRFTCPSARAAAQAGVHFVSFALAV
jgi:hypothetical protein